MLLLLIPILFTLVEVWTEAFIAKGVLSTAVFDSDFALKSRLFIAFFQGSFTTGFASSKFPKSVLDWLGCETKLKALEGLDEGCEANRST